MHYHVFEYVGVCGCGRAHACKTSVEPQDRGYFTAEVLLRMQHAQAFMHHHRYVKAGIWSAALNRPTPEIQEQRESNGGLLWATANVHEGNTQQSAQQSCGLRALNQEARDGRRSTMGKRNKGCVCSTTHYSDVPLPPCWQTSTTHAHPHHAGTCSTSNTHAHTILAYAAHPTHIHTILAHAAHPTQMHTTSWYKCAQAHAHPPPKPPTVSWHMRTLTVC
eukprot:1139515-Pelagomonas_calceolata.AAC.3